MVARPAVRSQKGAQAEARRRLAERMTEAEKVLGCYLAAGEQIEAFNAAIAEAEDRQADALVALAGIVGRKQAAELAAVDEARVRSALARAARDARQARSHQGSPQASKATRRSPANPKKAPG